MATQKEMISRMAEDIKSLKKSQPNGELKRMEAIMVKMTAQLEDLNSRIMDPETGLIVATNKNTEFRKECEPRSKEYTENFKALMRWKTMVDWGVGVFFVALIGAIVRYFTSN